MNWAFAIRILVELSYHHFAENNWCSCLTSPASNALRRAAGLHVTYLRYDIKGSFRNRKAKQHEAVGKDLNFDEEM